MTAPKEILRTECLKRLRQHSRRRNYGRDRIIVQRLYRHIIALGAKEIMLYVPLPIEVNISILFATLRRKGITIWLPVVTDGAMAAAPYRLPLEHGPFGICQPRPSRMRMRHLDLLVIPAIGADRHKRRIGFGKGMYDRFVAKYRRRIGHIVLISRITCGDRTDVGQPHDVVADTLLMGYRPW